MPKKPPAPRRPGAKPKPLKERRSARVQCTLPEDEAHALLALAERQAISQSEYIRAALAEYHAYLDIHLDPRKPIPLPKQQPRHVLFSLVLPAERAATIKYAKRQGLTEIAEHVRRALAYYQTKHHV